MVAGDGTTTDRAGDDDIDGSATVSEEVSDVLTADDAIGVFADVGVLGAWEPTVGW